MTQWGELFLEVLIDFVIVIFLILGGREGLYYLVGGLWCLCPCWMSVLLVPYCLIKRHSNALVKRRVLGPLGSRSWLGHLSLCEIGQVI